jgi:CRP/FNR family transcriptional regulator, cyclic AMP receptor protein
MSEREISTAFTRSYRAGTILFEEYDLGSRMYVIRSGRVKILKRYAEQEIVLAVLGPSDFFGEMALLENLPRSATAQVTEDAELIEVDAQTFEDMIRGNSEIAVRIMRKLASRVRELDRRLQHLLVESGTGRAIEVLRWLIPSGRPEGPWVRIPSQRAHVNIAAQAGITPTEVEEVLARLRQAGCLRDDGTDVLIADARTLDDYGTFLDLKRKYDPSVSKHHGHEPLPSGKDDINRALKRLLLALDVPGADEHEKSSALATQYKQYMALKQRFEPGEPAEG